MFIADFHIHSKYSRATSRECVPETLALWARRKGLDLVGTGDFTHPAWRAELKEKLEPTGGGLYALKKGLRANEGIAGGGAPPHFIVSGEISSIYKKNGRVRKVHNLILLPSFEAAEALSLRLEAIGNLHSDGRPILGLDSRDLLEITLDICPDALFIPAHIWTPHFSLFGAYSGFDCIRECFGDLTEHIHALETGLSSDPPMNWMLSALDGFAMISNSDAHSPGKLAREANIFECELSFSGVSRALKNLDEGGFRGTIEFFPEEGKYHLDGHRNCKRRFTPNETRELSGVCPVCGGRITTGVLHRVEELADRSEGFVPSGAKPYESLVPLREVIGASMGVGPASVKVNTRYMALLNSLGPELYILRKASSDDIERVGGPLIAEGIRRLRGKRVDIEAGYDGEYGKISILDKAEIERIGGQLSLFKDKGRATATKKRAKSASPTKHGSGAHKDTGKSALNAEQNEAVFAKDAVIAVMAGPGTGKTGTLAGRAERMILDGVTPGHITAVTFTNRAAREMRSRLKARLDGAGDITVGTFHSICLRLLYEAGLEHTVIDSGEALEIIVDILSHLGLKDSPRDILTAISLKKSGADGVCLPEKVFDMYNQRLARLGVLDFDDILLKGLELAMGSSPNPRFGHLLVDEFQDINPVQYRLIKAWANGGKSLFVIGDPNQSVYGFRGSDPRCFERLFEDFPAVRKVRLTENYRSTPEILLCAASLLCSEKPLNAMRAGGSAPRLIYAEDELEQARFVAKEINGMIGGVDMLSAHERRGGVSRGLSDIAVLYRTNRQSDALEKCLLSEGIPFTVAGRGPFLSEPAVRRALSFFRALPGCVETVKSPADLIMSWAQENGLLEADGMEKLINTALMYADMPSLLQSLTLGTEGDIQRSGAASYTPDAVHLMSLHAAKGLEFPVVFLCGLNEGLIPYKGRGMTNADEERRLLYVSMTRARDELILLAYGSASPFLESLPDSVIRGEAFEKKPEQISLFDM